MKPTLGQGSLSVERQDEAIALLASGKSQG